MKRKRISTKQLEETWELFQDELELKLGYSVELFIPGGGVERKVYNTATGDDIISGNNGIIQSWIITQIRANRKEVT